VAFGVKREYKNVTWKRITTKEDYVAVEVTEELPGELLVP
jgi:hypothetical protein